MSEEKKTQHEKGRTENGAGGKKLRKNATEALHSETPQITKLIEKAAKKARAELGDNPIPDLYSRVRWPLQCTVGPGLEGAIACETRIGYVNGSMGKLIYRGYDIFDLCAYSSYEEVCYLLLTGKLPNSYQLETFKKKLNSYMYLPNTLRVMIGFPIQDMHPMAALRLGTNLMRQRLTWRDIEGAEPSIEDAIAADEDSIPMETLPRGERNAIYEFRPKRASRPNAARKGTGQGTTMGSCMHLIGGMPTLAAAIARIRAEKLPIEPRPDMSHAANFLYMMTGRIPTKVEERIMDVSLILHADHGMNASTFASMVVASTLSDIYFSIGAGVAALFGPLHGGANEMVIRTLRDIGNAKNVPRWYEKTRQKKQRVMGFGHRVYKAYDPRARILKPLADQLSNQSPEIRDLFETAHCLEERVVSDLGEQKKIFPNVDFYSGLVYAALGIPLKMYTPIFAVSRVAGWTARIYEYLKTNRIFRPRAWYVGDMDVPYVSIGQRDADAAEEKKKARKPKAEE